MTSPLASALRAALAADGATRVNRESLERAAVAADSSMGYSHDRRERLHSALKDLETAGIISLPKSPKSYEARPSPPLPNWVRYNEVAIRPRTRPDDKLWRTELVQAASLARTTDERQMLETISAFLRDGGGDRPMVPSRERSLELFGDEKRLDALRRHRFFTSGALTLDLLRCFDVPLPFPSTYIANAPQTVDPAPLLIAENHHTYASLTSAVHRAVSGGHPPLHVGWGAGNSFPQSVFSVEQLVPKVDRIHYFGDLDEGGLATAVAVSTKMRGSSSPVRPATGLYLLLLEVGVPRPVKPVEPERALRLAEWLGPELAPRAAALLIDGIALRQEAVGTELLLNRGFPKLDQDPP